MRTPLVPVLLGVALALAACAPAAGPSPEPTADAPSPSPTTEPVGGAFEPCDEATVDSLTASLDGQLLFEPEEGTYPPYLPAPSCIAYPTEQGLSIAFFAGATETDFETIEAAVVEQQGPGQAIEPIADPLLAAEIWDSGGVIDLRYFTTSNGVTGPYIQATSVIANYTPGG